MSKRKLTLSNRLSKLSRSRQIIVYILILLILTIPLLYINDITNKPEIVVYDLTGTILTTGQNAITPKQVHDIRIEINDSSNIKAAVLFIDSPGGSVWASQEIANEISQIDKPVVACLGETAASGGYYIASGCDKIVTYQTTLTGSIGVIMMLVNMSELMDKVGIRVETYSLGQYKDIYDGFRNLDDGEKEVINITVAIMYNHFVNTVAINRGLKPDYVKNLATGQIYTGYEAVQLELADQLGTVDDAIALAAEMSGADKNKVDDRRYNKGFFSSITGSIGGWIDLISRIPDNITRVEFQYR